MKKIVFFLVINFLIYHGTAEFMFSRPVNYFLSFFGVRSYEQYQEIPTVPEKEETLKIERIYEPLELVLVSFKGDDMMAAIGNPLFLREYIRNGEFVDVIFACPKKENEEDAKLAKKLGTDKVPETRTLIIERSYISFVNKYIKEAELLGKTTKNNENDAPNGKNGEVKTTNSNQKLQPKQDTVSHQEHIEKKDVKKKYTSMEIDNFAVISNLGDEDDNLPESPEQGTDSLSKKKIKRSDSLERISREDQTIPKKNKIESLDQAEENQEENTSGQNKMEIDAGSIRETDETGLKKTENFLTPIQETAAITNEPETGSVPNKKPSKAILTKSLSIKSEAPAKPKFKRAWENLTIENEQYWLQGFNDVENFKCERPVRIHLLVYSSNDICKIYIAGFEVHIDKLEDLDYPEFRKESSSNRKLKWFWAFTIIFMKKDRNVCVFHEIQYNKDTGNLEINDDFDDHDLGKDDMFPGLDIIKVYERENQERVFGDLFKNIEKRKLYFDPDEGKLLERVHLAPLQGFVSPVVRQSAKTYGNIAPMWKSIRNGAWGNLEEYVNMLSYVLKHLIVITGTYGTLVLDEKEVYLTEDKTIPVPLAFWKMVIYGSDLESCRGILFVTSNNPYEYIGNVICKQDKCEDFGWIYVREDTLTRGHTLCCDFTGDILTKLPILKNAQPSEVLNLFELFPIVKDIWEFDEQGEPTTREERIQILEVLEVDERLKGKITAGAFNEIMNETEGNENSEMKDEGKNKNTVKTDKAVPQVLQESGVFLFPKTHIEI